MAYHAVDVAAAHKKAIFRFAKAFKIFAVVEARLCEHADAIAFVFEQAADNCRAETGVVYIGVAAHDDEIELAPTAFCHIIAIDGQKLCI